MECRHSVFLYTLIPDASIMKKKILFFLISWSFYTQSELVLIDKVVATVYHPEGTFIILQSDLKLDINGMLRTIEGEIDDNLMLLDAKRLKFESTDQDTENFLAQVGKEHNLSKADLEDEFDKMGYTPKDAHNLLKRYQSVEKIKEFKVKNTIVIDTSEVTDYYNASLPEERAKKYTVQFGAAQKNGLITDIPKETIVWEEPLILSQDSIATDKLFIIDLPLNEVTYFDETENSIEFIRILKKDISEKEIAPEIYREIEHKLKKIKYDQALHAYKESLRESATIIYHNTD